MKTLFVLLGPTGVGKTDTSLSIAGLLSSPIINADSRQIYREIPIATAAPTQAQQAVAPHYFVGTHSIHSNYSAAQYESDVLQLLTKLFETHNNLLLTGGSMLYIDAVCKGIDDLPTIRPDIRELLTIQLQTQGLQALTQQLHQLDPISYERIDLNNPRRVVHALEVCMQTGQPYSTFLGRKTTQRPFRIVKIGLQRPREQLYERIDQRVDQMISNGLIEEAHSMQAYQHLNALNTVGLKEMFLYFSGTFTYEEAVEKIKRNSRVYSRKQMTWFCNDASVVWFNPDHKQSILHFVNDQRSEAFTN